MHAVLQRPLSRTAQCASQPVRVAVHKGETSPERVACVLGGSGLVVCGLLRGTWLGLAVAAAGGFLLYRGLTRPRQQATHDETPAPLGIPAVAEEAASSGSVFEPSEEENCVWSEVAGASDEMVADPDQPFQVRASEQSPCSKILTAEEHAHARVQAYYFALERGHGGVPPYDPGRAADDFCRAVVEVRAGRAGGR